MILTLEEAREELLSLYEVYFAPNFYSLGTPEYSANIIKQIRCLLFLLLLLDILFIKKADNKKIIKSTINGVALFFIVISLLILVIKKKDDTNIIKKY